MEAIRPQMNLSNVTAWDDSPQHTVSDTGLQKEHKEVYEYKSYATVFIARLHLCSI